MSFAYYCIGRSFRFLIIAEVQSCTGTHRQSGSTGNTPGFLQITTIIFIRQNSCNSGQLIQNKSLYLLYRITGNVRSIILHHGCYQRHLSELGCQIQIRLCPEKTSLRFHPFFQRFIHFALIDLFQEVIHDTNRSETISTVFRRTQFTLLDRFVRAFPRLMAMCVIRTHFIPDIETVPLCITSIQTVPCIFLRCPETFSRYIRRRDHIQITCCKRGSH